MKSQKLCVPYRPNGNSRAVCCASVSLSAPEALSTEELKVLVGIALKVALKSSKHPVEVKEHLCFLLERFGLQVSKLVLNLPEGC